MKEIFAITSVAYIFAVKQFLGAETLIASVILSAIAGAAIIAKDEKSNPKFSISDTYFCSWFFGILLSMAGPFGAAWIYYRSDKRGFSNPFWIKRDFRAENKGEGTPPTETER
jgi:hypothetical protein